MTLAAMYTSVCFTTIAGDPSEWHAATSLFNTNAAHLVSSIKNVLEASRLAQALPNHHLSPTTLHPTSLITQESHTSATAVTPAALSIVCPGQGLQIPALNTVYRSLYPLRAQWKTLGTLLNIERGTLEAIEKDNRGTTEDCLSTMVRHIAPPATWQVLYEAVQYIDLNQAQRICGMAERSGGTVVDTQHSSNNQAGSVVH